MPSQFTQSDLAAHAKIPEGFERIPPEHQAKYFLLALEQMSMVQTTLTRVILKAMAKDNSELGFGQIGGCAAGLRRAAHYVEGLRAVSGYEPPKLPEAPVVVAQPQGSGEPIMSGAQAFAAHLGVPDA